jgi:hypothetical protein
MVHPGVREVWGGAAGNPFCSTPYPDTLFLVLRHVFREALHLLLKVSCRGAKDNRSIRAELLGEDNRPEAAEYIVHEDQARHAADPLVQPTAQWSLILKGQTAQRNEPYLNTPCAKDLMGECNN